MSPDQAELHGLSALAWLAGNDELFPIFMGTTGANVADFQSESFSKETLVAILDFILMDDAYVTEFCDAGGLEYTIPLIAREVLGGGDNPHWT